MIGSARIARGLFLLLLLFLLPGTTLPAGLMSSSGGVAQGASTDEIVVTARRTNYVREGPGSFHKVVVAVKKNIPLKVLKRKEGWIRVRLPDDRTGWIAITSVQTGAETEETSMKDVADEWTSAEATESGVAAAVRGFQMRTEGLEEGSTKQLLAYLKSTPVVTESDLEHFRRPLEEGDRSDLDLGDLDVDFERFDPSVRERQVGFAVASRLVSKGLVKAPRLQRYLTLMAEQLTADTPYYDVQFDVVIVNGSGPDAFACPGGIIFVTRGVFTQFENEAQIAGLLAHEIAHVVRHHGMTEMDEREVRRASEDAFAELEEATGEDEGKYEQVEEDLATVMQKSYDRVVNDRLLKYEKEADRIAAGLLGEAGYSPMGIVNAVHRMTALRANDPDLFDEEYLAAENAEKRLYAVTSFVEDEHDGDGKTLARRFRAYDDEIR